MLKELQEKLKLEVDRMEKALAAKISEALNEEGIFAKVAEDLSVLTVGLVKEKEEEGRVYQTEYIFNFSVSEEGRKNKTYSSQTSVLLLNGKRVVGTYTSPTSIDLDLLNFIFVSIDQFRDSELNAEEVKETPKEQPQADNLF